MPEPVIGGAGGDGIEPLDTGTTGGDVGCAGGGDGEKSKTDRGGGAIGGGTGGTSGGETGGGMGGETGG